MAKQRLEIPTLTPERRKSLDKRLHRLRPVLLAYAIRMGSQSKEDTLQDAIVAMLKSPSFRDIDIESDQFKFWMLNAVKFAVTAHYRRMASKEQQLSDDTEVYSRFESIEAWTIRQSHFDRLCRSSPNNRKFDAGKVRTAVTMIRSGYRVQDVVKRLNICEYTFRKWRRWIAAHYYD